MKVDIIKLSKSQSDLLSMEGYYDISDIIKLVDDDNIFYSHRYILLNKLNTKVNKDIDRLVRLKELLILIDVIPKNTSDDNILLLDYEQTLVEILYSNNTVLYKEKSRELFNNRLFNGKL